MYCPECGTEYRPGFTECSDCRVALVERPPETPEDHPEPGLELVTVLEGNNPLAAAVAKTSLEQAGIPYFMAGEEGGSSVIVFDPLINRWWRVQVARESQDQARALLDEAISKDDLVIDIDAEQQPLPGEP